MSNRLKNSTSPYLLQHAENPVDWYPWSDEALKLAKKEDKPIFLSIGYAACHWCHVMAHESFEDPDTAALMNEHFINIKVDREERPDIDAVYMDAVVAMTGQGGWPMSIFLTPDGKPFYGGTYFPPTQRYNIPSFRSLLQGISQAWTEDRRSLENRGSALVDHIRKAPSIHVDDRVLDPGIFKDAVEVLFKNYDWTHGGWGAAPKFPQSMAVDYLFRHFDRHQEKLALDMGTHALKSMAKGGMYDLIGGGFHRYSVDEVWLVPHFEKMLYDNALLAKTFVEAWQITQDPFFREVAEDTFTFLRRELEDPSGGFYSSLDADSDGEEGTYYIWEAGEIEEVLQDPLIAQLITRHYGISSRGNFEGKNIPTRSEPVPDLAEELNLQVEDAETRFRIARSALLEYREERVYPGLDNKVLTFWNSLALTAFCTASRVLSREVYYPVAQRLGEFLTTEMIVEGRLMRSWRDGTANYSAYLEDHASLGLGLLDLYQLDFNPRWYEMAADQAEEILAHFSDVEGGFFDTRDDHETLITRPKSLQDTPTPSGNSLATNLLLRLTAYSGDGRYLEKVEPVLASMQVNAKRYPAAFGGWLCALDFAIGPQLQLALVSPDELSNALLLADVAYRRFLPRLVMAGSNSNLETKPALLEGRSVIDQLPTAYLCQAFACKLPTTSPEELARQIDQSRSS